MKSIREILFYAILLVLTAFSSCMRHSTNKEVLTSKIQYDVPVNNNDPQLDWWINNIEGSKREPFLQRIIQAAEKGDVKIFDYYNNALNSNQLSAILTDTVYLSLVRPYPPYEEYDTMVINSRTFRDISKIRFLEEWKWDPESLEIEKEVIAIGPVVQQKIGSESFNQLLFWIYLDKHLPGE